MTDFAAVPADRLRAPTIALRSVTTISRSPEGPAPWPSSNRSSRELCAHAALGYATRALSVAREGRRADAVEAVEAATDLLPMVGQANPRLAVQVRLAIARTQIVLGALEAACSAVCEVEELLQLLPDDENLRDEADTVMAALIEQRDRAPVGFDLITQAEARVLNLLPSYASYKEIASRLHISPNTVKSHAYSVYRKLGVGSRSEAVRVSRRLGLVAA